MSEKPTPNRVPLKVMVDEKQQRVAFAEANASFADTIFSFLTLPLGTVVKILGSHESNLTIGCINNLYQSVVNLDSNLFQTSNCKTMLLHPINATHHDYKGLKVKVDAQDWKPAPMHYPCKDCGNFSFYEGIRCDCGKEKSGTPTEACLSGAFVERDAIFVISDDMQVLPLSTSSILSLVEAQGLTTECNYLKERMVYFEVCQLLFAILSSNTPLTDLVFSKKSQTGKVDSKMTYDQKHPDEENCVKNNFTLKLIFRKLDRKLLYAEAGTDFVDVIFSFLGFPLGALVKLLGGKPPTKCLNTLYNSIDGLGSQSLIKSEDQLLCPTLAPHFYCNGHLIPIVGELYSRSYNCSGLNYGCRIMKPMNSAGEKGFVKGSGVFMVTDDLVVTPLSSTHVLSLFDLLKVRACDVREKEIFAGKSEVITLLMASVTSNQALTDVFRAHIDSS